MAHPKHRTSRVGKTRRSRGRIRVKESIHVQRKDNTNVVYKTAPIQMPRDNGLNMRIKIRRK